MNTLANFDNPLPHIWPKGGIWGLHPFLQGHYSIGCDYLSVANSFRPQVCDS